MTYDAYFELLREAFKKQDTDGGRFNYGIARHSTIKTDAVVRHDSGFTSPIDLQIANNSMDICYSSSGSSKQT